MLAGLCLAPKLFGNALLVLMIGTGCSGAAIIAALGGPRGEDGCGREGEELTRRISCVPGMTHELDCATKYCCCWE